MNVKNARRESGRETQQNALHLHLFSEAILSLPFYKMLLFNSGSHCPLCISLHVLSKLLLSSFSPHLTISLTIGM